MISPSEIFYWWQENQISIPNSLGKYSSEENLPIQIPWGRFGGTGIWRSGCDTAGLTHVLGQTVWVWVLALFPFLASWEAVKMTPGLQSCPLTWEVHVEFQATSFDLVQPQMLQPSGKWNSKWHILLSLCLSKLIAWVSGDCLSQQLPKTVPPDPCCKWLCPFTSVCLHDAITFCVCHFMGKVAKCLPWWIQFLVMH